MEVSCGQKNPQSTMILTSKQAVHHLHRWGSPTPRNWVSSRFSTRSTTLRKLSSTKPTIAMVPGPSVIYSSFSHVTSSCFAVLKSPTCSVRASCLGFSRQSSVIIQRLVSCPLDDTRSQMCFQSVSSTHM